MNDRSSLADASTALDPFAKLLDAHTIRLERDLPGPIERVWQYLVDPDKRESWLGRSEVPATVGGEFQKTMRGEDGTPFFTLHMRTSAYDPPHLLEYVLVEMTGANGPIRDSVVRFELAQRGERVHLTLTHSALPSDAYTSIGTGWHSGLDVLVALVSGIGPTDAYAEYERIAPYYGEVGTFPTPDSVRIERAFAVPPDRVWAYLTQADLLSTWFAHGAVPETVGTPFVLTTILNDDAIHATILAYDRPRTLAYSWLSTFCPKRDGTISTVRFELTPDESGTLLVLTHSGVDAAARAALGAGWHTFLGRLAVRLIGQAPDAFATASARVQGAYDALAR